MVLASTVARSALSALSKLCSAKYDHVAHVSRRNDLACTLTVQDGLEIARKWDQVGAVACILVVRPTKVPREVRRGLCLASDSHGGKTIGVLLRGGVDQSPGRGRATEIL